MVIYDNKVVLDNGRWIIGYREPEPPPPPVYNVILNQTTGGTISASPMSGIDGTTVTLSNSPSTNYTFNGYTISGSTLYNNNKFDINGSDVTCSASWTYVDPYNPLNLPPNTMRLKYKDGVTPSGSLVTYKQVSSSPNIWDATANTADNIIYVATRNYEDILEVLGANTTGATTMKEIFVNCTNLTSIALFDTSSVTNMYSMIRYCRSLTSVPLFDTSNVTDMSYMFWNSNSLTTLPLFNTSKVTNMNYMCYNCSSLTSIPLLDTSSVIEMNATFSSCANVSGGALALYQQASNNPNITTHIRTFSDCGWNTQTGRAELSQIPSDWK